MFELTSELTFQLKALAAIAALVIAGSAVRATLRSKRRLPLPPGPPGHWLFGNALPRVKYVQLVGSIAPTLTNVDRKSQSQQFAAWVNQYGPVISLRVGPRVMIIIGRHKVGVNVLAKLQCFDSNTTIGISRHHGERGWSVGRPSSRSCSGRNHVTWTTDDSRTRG